MRIINKDKRHVYITIVLGTIAVFVNCFISLFITPRITNTIGIESYGYVTLAKNFVAYATILTTALNSYASRYMSIAYLKGDKEKFREYFSTVFWGDVIVGAILFGIGTIFVLFIDRLINVDNHLLVETKMLFFTCFVAFFVNTASTVFMAIGYVKDRMETINIIKICSYIAEVLVLVICFWFMRPSIWYVGLSSLSMALVVFIGSYTLTKITLPERSILRQYISKKSFVELVGNGFWNSANSLGNTLNSGLDLLITNLMLTSVAMGQVSIAKTINNIIFALYVAISQAFQPKMIKYYSECNTKCLIHEFKRSMKVSGIITNCILAGFIAVGKEFLALWIPGQDIAKIYFITIIAMLPCVTEGCVYPLYYAYTLTIKNKIPCLVTIAGGLLNVVGMYLLLKFTKLGVYSIVITTAIIMNLIVGVFNPVYISKCLNVRKSMFIPDIVWNILMLTITTFILMRIGSFISYGNSWHNFTIKTCFLALVGMVLQISLTYLLTRVISKGRWLNA